MEKVQEDLAVRIDDRKRSRKDVFEYRFEAPEDGVQSEFVDNMKPIFFVEPTPQQAVRELVDKLYHESIQLHSSFSLSPSTEWVEMVRRIEAKVEKKTSESEKWTLGAGEKGERERMDEKEKAEVIRTGIQTALGKFNAALGRLTELQELLRILIHDARSYHSTIAKSAINSGGGDSDGAGESGVESSVSGGVGNWTLAKVQEREGVNQNLLAAYRLAERIEMYKVLIGKNILQAANTSISNAIQRDALWFNELFELSHHFVLQAGVPQPASNNSGSGTGTPFVEKMGINAATVEFSMVLAMDQTFACVVPLPMHRINPNDSLTGLNQWDRRLRYLHQRTSMDILLPPLCFGTTHSAADSENNKRVSLLEWLAVDPCNNFWEEEEEGRERLRGGKSVQVVRNEILSACQQACLEVQLFHSLQNEVLRYRGENYCITDLSSTHISFVVQYLRWMAYHSVCIRLCDSGGKRVRTAAVADHSNGEGGGRGECEFRGFVRVEIEVRKGESDFESEALDSAFAAGKLWANSETLRKLFLLRLNQKNHYEYVYSRLYGGSGDSQIANLHSPHTFLREPLLLVQHKALVVTLCAVLRGNLRVSDETLSPSSLSLALVDKHVDIQSLSLPHVYTLRGGKAIIPHNWRFREPLRPTTMYEYSTSLLFSISLSPTDSLNPTTATGMSDNTTGTKGFDSFLRISVRNDRILLPGAEEILVSGLAISSVLERLNVWLRKRFLS